MSERGTVIFLLGLVLPAVSFPSAFFFSSFFGETVSMDDKIRSMKPILTSTLHDFLAGLGPRARVYGFKFRSNHINS